MEHYYRILENGIKVVHVPIQSKVAYICLGTNTGSRDELPGEEGYAHFLEHMLFKGTKNRSNWHILNRMESVGGDLNAYTSKEETFVYSTSHIDYTERALELLADVVFASTFPEKEMRKEVDVIIDEINSYLDSPSELIFDDIEELIFKGHTLAHNILGTEENLKAITPEKLIKFYNRTYNTDQMILCIMGDLSRKKVDKLVDKYYSTIPSNRRTFTRSAPLEIDGISKQDIKTVYQAHVIEGYRAFHLHSPERATLALLTNYLGGPGMNSRLNLNLRERNGIAYNVESHYSAMSDCGMLTIYFGTEEENLKKSKRIIEKEIQLLKTKPLSETKLQAAKKQILGQILISNENRENTLLNIAKSYLHYNGYDSFEQLSEKVNKITSENILEVANKVFDDSKTFELKYIPSPNSNEDED